MFDPQKSTAPDSSTHGESWEEATFFGCDDAKQLKLKPALPRSKTRLP